MPRVCVRAYTNRLNYYRGHLEEHRKEEPLTLAEGGEYCRVPARFIDVAPCA